MDLQKWLHENKWFKYSDDGTVITSKEFKQMCFDLQADNTKLVGNKIETSIVTQEQINKYLDGITKFKPRGKKATKISD